MIHRLKNAPRFIASVFNMFRLAWQAHPTFLGGIIFLTIFQGGMPLASAWITKLLFDLLAQSLIRNAAVNWPQLLWLLAAQALLTVSGQMMAPAYNYLNAELGRKLTLEIQSTVYQKINSFAGIAYFENAELYDTIQLAQQGAQLSSSQTVTTVTSLVQSTVTLGSFLGVLLAFSPLLVGLVLVAAVPHLYAQFKFGRQRFGLAYQTSQHGRRKFLYSFILSSSHAAKEVRLFDLGGYFLDKVIQLYKKVHQAERSQQAYELRWKLLLNALSSLVASGAFVIVIAQAFNGHLSLGDVTLYVSAVASAQGGLGGIVSALASLNESALFYTYFANLLALPQPLSLSESPHPVEKLGSGIELRHVSFRYSEEHPWVLRDVNLYIPAGQCLALVGLNGAGKTTLVKLLLRFYDPSEGQILWDGTNIREFEPAALRRRIGAVFQDFMRYDLTAQENIGLGDIKHVEDIRRVREAAAKASIHDKIEQLPQGYQTTISLMFGGEGPSVDLSTGEWQKIATARMFMRESDLLILDEPTAALDAQAEHDTYNHFVELLAGRTSVLISHRFSTVRMADVIAVLENGKITEYGSHEQLLALAGTYAKLYTMQAEKYN